MKMSFDNIESGPGQAELEGQRNPVFRATPVPSGLIGLEGTVPTHAETAEFGTLDASQWMAPEHAPDSTTGAHLISRAELAGHIKELGLLDYPQPAEAPSDDMSGPVYNVEHRPETGDTEVHVTSRVTLEQTEKAMTTEDRQRFHELVEQSRGLKIRQINATAKGGGVARINKVRTHTLKNLYELDFEWHALDIDTPAAEVTKNNFHNTLQDVAPEGTVLTEQNKATYEAMIARNFELMKDMLVDADVIMIDDWQPTGLIPYIKGYWEETNNGHVWHEGINPGALLIVQDHIQTEGEKMVTPGTPQNITWEYLWKNNMIYKADAFPIHPVKDFKPPNVPDEMVVFMTANCDLNDDFHRQMNRQETLDAFAAAAEELGMNENQKPIELDENLNPVREYDLVSARYDRAKGLNLAIEMYLKERALLIASGVSEDKLPQFVMQGFGSVDDPEGEEILKDMMDIRALTSMLDPAIYGHNIMDDLKIIRTKHNDLLLNALMWKARLYLQPSTREGMEDAVSGALFHDKVVLGSDQGGIPHQIIHGENGYVHDPHDTDTWAQRMHDLHMDELHYKRMQRRVRELARTHNYQLITTGPNTINFLGLIKLLKDDRQGFKGNERWPAEILYAQQEEQAA